MLDIDRQHGLKAINDTYGHQAGDKLLCWIGELLRDNVRLADVVARYGGDEFIIMAPQTGIDKALTLATRVRKILAESEFRYDGETHHITVSIGVAVFQPGHKESASSVVSLADQGLYLAKERGGNQVCMIELDPSALSESS
jgi:two-component system cell cycle response regulator